MDFATWLDAETGRSAALADHFNVSRSAVSQWRGNGVPAEHMQAVCAFSGGVVTIAGLVEHKRRRAVALKTAA